jgi:hypothetical protein
LAAAGTLGGDVIAARALGCRIASAIAVSVGLGQTVLIIINYGEEIEENYLGPNPSRRQSQNFHFRVGVT